MAQSVLFDRYELLEPAGRGGTAEVWRALDRETGSIVAVKRLHPVVFADPAARQRLEREFRLLGDLDEPHIVRVRDLQVGDREAALILDFVAGESLSERLARDRAASRRTSPAETVAIVEDVAAALSAAHAAGLVHRDVTPSNILLGTDGMARLTDFGIARANGDATAVTATDTVVGTLRYLAPEQLRGEPATPASDLHGLAAVAWEIVAGRPAYDAPNPVALVEAQRAGPEPVADVPAPLARAIRAGLDPDPARRPADVSAFAASLARAVSAPADADAATVAIALPSAAVFATTPPSDREGRRNDAWEHDRPRAVARGALAGSADPAAMSSARDVHGPRRVGALTRRVPAPAVAAIGLALAVLVVAAAGGLDRTSPTGAGDRRPLVSTPHVTATPKATPQPVQAGDGNGGGKGDGKGKDDGGGNGKGKGKGNDG
jgi:serine/threonine protein kinase